VRPVIPLIKVDYVLVDVEFIATFRPYPPTTWPLAQEETKNTRRADKHHHKGTLNLEPWIIYTVYDPPRIPQRFRDVCISPPEKQTTNHLSRSMCSAQRSNFQIPPKPADLINTITLNDEKKRVKGVVPFQP